jgi:Zn-dependent peptidase ImmA (M78 family)/DNA-binding XRE family transcriptional regulator
MEQEILAKRLKKIREDKGITQQKAADALGIPRTAITQIENANRNISTLELSKLAELYHCTVVELLETREREDAFRALLRASSTVKADPALQKTIEEYLILCREGVTLEKILGISGQKTPPQYDKSIPENPMQAIRQGEQIAKAERQRLGLGTLPVADMGELISDQGIWVVCADFPDDLSGMCLRDETIGTAVIVNRRHHRHRRRFSFAHEYAHALLDGDRAVNLTGQDNASEFIEKRANGFAAEFLIPAEGIAVQLEILQKLPIKDGIDIMTGEEVRPSRKLTQTQEITYQDVALISRHFGVSYESVAYRLSGLRYINKPSLEVLLQQRETAKRYLEFLQLLEDEPAEQPVATKEIVQHLIYLAIEAYRREEISKGKLLSIGRLTGKVEDLLEFAEVTRFDAC